MADMAASVLARLKNKAAATGRSHQLCMQVFCQEEFLRRLEKSKYAENFVLKGGLFVYAVTDFDSRVTVDVDFLLRKIPNTPEQVQAVLEEIISVPTENDFVTFEIKSVGPIAEVYTHDTKQKSGCWPMQPNSRNCASRPMMTSRAACGLRLTKAESAYD